MPVVSGAYVPKIRLLTWQIARWREAKIALGGGLPAESSIHLSPPESFLSLDVTSTDGTYRVSA
jgi:hypothetical protein